jgi:predicted 2-oxoglutarate/Fe(II)-dependent dioxygenase YbiX
MYYNDNYEGGELGVVGGSSVKPTPGSVVVFPSKYLHESTLITSGIKYVSNEVVRLDSSFLREI